MIMINDKANEDALLVDPHFLPASHISCKDGITLLDYMENATNPTALISNGKTQVGIKPSPMMASFSSRGPSKLYPQILKPDITAPGVSIIAAFPSGVGPSGVAYDTRRVTYNVMSGTSMSCPHVSGVLGLLKSLHPDWSPAAIRSALMITVSKLHHSDAELVILAANPGLIYDLSENDYLEYLCTVYNEKDVKVFSKTNQCKNPKSFLDLNYPSITVTNFSASATASRTVTNVGNPNTYVVNVTAPSGVNITVNPSTLKFHQIGEKQTFSIEFKANGDRPTHPEYVFGSLVWSDGSHNVRSPIVVERV